MAKAFDPCPQTDKAYEASRRFLHDAFAAWSNESGTGLGPDAIEGLIHYKWGYLDRHLTCWQCADFDAVLLELYPAKMIVEDEDLDDVIPETIAFVSFLAESGLLDEESDDVKALVAHLEQMGPSFRAAMADTSRYSPGKRLMTAAAKEGLSPEDPDGLAAFIEAFNARPCREREAVLGPAAHTRASGGRFTPHGTPPNQPRKRRRSR